VYDVRGRRVAELIGGVYLEAGAYRVEWAGFDYQGRRVASGIYYTQLRLNRTAVGATRRLVLIE
jgi:hypothetical protein